MEIEKSHVEKIVIKNIIESNQLDPITVFLEDFEPRKGKITIECYGKSWSSFWGGMGNRSISQFFCSCDEHYLSKNLSSIKSTVEDKEAYQAWVRARIIELRKETFPDITADEAREMWDESEEINEDTHLQTHWSLLAKLFGDDWWYSIPEKPNHDYEYLCRIITTVQEALRSLAMDKAA